MLVLTKLNEDLTGRQFGRLVVLYPVRKYKSGHIVWACLCACGRNHEASGPHLKRGDILSCGCHSRESASRRFTKHGYTNRSGPGRTTYTAWQHMKKRCLDPKANDYGRYGGRGIRVCDAWVASFEAFLEHMGPKPGPGHSLDRINVDGHYEPGNVRWATAVEQQNNKRNNLLITADGKTQSLEMWARERGIRSGKIRDRIVKLGWHPEEALEFVSKRC